MLTYEITITKVDGSYIGRTVDLNEVPEIMREINWAEVQLFTMRLL